MNKKIDPGSHAYVMTSDGVGESSTSFVDFGEEAGRLTKHGLRWLEVEGRALELQIELLTEIW